MNVGQLKQFLEDLPNDVEIYVIDNTEPFDAYNRFKICEAKHIRLHYSSVHKEEVVVLTGKVL